MTMAKLERLEREARSAAQSEGRGHILSPFARRAESGSGRKMVADAVCLKPGCTRDVRVDTDPPPNGIDIGGEAVALGCSGSPYLDAGTLVEMGDVIERTRVLGGSRHFFDPATMRFFGSRVGAYGYLTAGGARAYFVTSERDSGQYAAWDGARRYTVRVQSRDTGEIGEAGGFGQYASRSGADSAAQRLARGLALRSEAEVIAAHRARHVIPADWCPACARIAELESAEVPA